MNYTSFRLKFRHFMQKNKTILLLVFLVWATIYFINMLLRYQTPKLEPTTTLKEHSSIMEQTSSTPRSLQEDIEDLISEYVQYCNEGNFQKAFNLLSDDCKEHEYDNDVKKFMKHVEVKMPTPKQYAIQDYSNVTAGGNKVYIYQIKYTEDLLATGLTGLDYSFTSEMMTFYVNDDGELMMNVGNYIYYTPIQSVTENDYLKIDVIDKLVNYSTEEYTVRLTNRSPYTIVLCDGEELDEIGLALNNELRKCANVDKLVLKPNDVTKVTFEFQKFVDDGDTSSVISFSSVRVMEKYSGTGEEVDKETRKQEIDNALAKMSMSVSVKE